MGFDLTGKSGNYFQANIWSWRPILALCEELNDEKKLNLNLDGWGMNDGEGLHNRTDCLKLAYAIEEHVKQGRQTYTLQFEGSLAVNSEGQFVERNTPGAKSPYETDAEHILEFVKFLRECGGGFEIF